MQTDLCAFLAWFAPEMIFFPAHCGAESPLIGRSAAPNIYAHNTDADADLRLNPHRMRDAMHMQIGTFFF